jgi:hypothetical protein
MSSPRWSIVGFEADDVFGADDVDWYGVAGAGRPESWGVGVADDMLGWRMISILKYALYQ